VLLNATLKNPAVMKRRLPGKTDIIEHAVKLSDDKPVTSRPYRSPYVVRENLKTEISDMLKMVIIRKSTSPYASRIVIAKKKDGSNTWTTGNVHL